MNRIPTDPLSLDAFIMATSRQHQPHKHQSDDATMTDSNSPANSTSMMSAFSDFAVNYQNGAFNGPQLTSPGITTDFFNPPPQRRSASNASEAHHSTSPIAHRHSISSAGPRPNLHVDSSDLMGGAAASASPSSAHPASKSDENLDGASANAAGMDLDAHDMSKQGDGGDGGPPPWSEMKTKAGKERKRLPLACIACRRKKIRCSGEKPACKHCLRSRIPCVYKVTTRKAAPRTDYMAMLDKRLKRMEDRVIKLIPKESLPAVIGVSRAVVKPPIPGAPVKVSNKKRIAEEAFGQELDDWSKTKGANPADALGVRKTQEEDDTALLLEGAESLPSKELQDHLSEVYFDYIYAQSYPLLHKPSFMRKLSAGTVPPVLMLAVCAISARFSTHPQVRTEPAFLRGESWAAKAREIALRRFDSPNITILIVYLLLGLHEFGTCQGGRSWMFGGMAQRMAYALLLHRDLDYDPRGGENGEKAELSATDREIRRRTMWACFLMDRFNSSGTDRPLFVNEQFIQAQLPIKEHYFQMEITGPTETLEGDVIKSASDSHELFLPKENMGTIAYLIRLVAIWGQLVKYMNLGGRAKDPHPMWHPESKYQDLKKQAQDWKASLPDCLQYGEENLQMHSTEKTANQFLFMHITYWQVVLFMNRFALPAPPGIRGEVPAVQEFFATAARTAFDAASQISVMINESMDHNVVAPFVGYSAFFSSTVHIFGVFSKNPKLEVTSKKYLAYNVKYLSKMKKYWGMLNFVAENLKELYRQHADNVLRGAGAAGKTKGTAIFQYGDWFDRYPHGVSKTDFEDPAAQVKKEAGTDAVLGQKSDLQSVEEFFASLSPPSKAEASRKMAKKGKHAKSASRSDTVVAGDRQRSQSLHHQQQQQAPSSQPPHQSHTQHQPHDQESLFPDQVPLSANSLANFSHPNYLSLNPRQPGQLDTTFSSTNQQHNSHLPAQQSQSPFTPQGPHANQLSLMDFAATGAFPNIDPTTMALLSPSNQQQNMWPGMDLGGFAGGYTMTGEPSGAWFMPFNVDPPDIGNDGGIFGGEFGGGFDGFGTGGSNAGGITDEVHNAQVAGSAGGGPPSGSGDDLEGGLQF